MFDSTTTFEIDGKTLVRAAMPKIYRIVDLKRVAINDTLVCWTATLHHRRLNPRVVWTCRAADHDVKQLDLVTIRWASQPVCEDGVLHISRLVSVKTPDENVNLFDTVPPVLVPDDLLVKRARALFNRLSRKFKQIFNAMFLDTQRLLWFAAGPASLHGPYAGISGNLRHSIEVAETALRIANGRSPAFPALIILGSLLRNAVKAEQYRLHPAEDRFVASSSAELFDRPTALDWLMEAITVFRIDIPISHRAAIRHILSNPQNAAERVGACESPPLEASIILMAERWLERDAVTKVR